MTPLYLDLASEFKGVLWLSPGGLSLCDRVKLDEGEFASSATLWTW